MKFSLLLVALFVAAAQAFPAAVAPEADFGSALQEAHKIREAVAEDISKINALAEKHGSGDSVLEVFKRTEFWNKLSEKVVLKPLIANIEEETLNTGGAHVYEFVFHKLRDISSADLILLFHAQFSEEAQKDLQTIIDKTDAKTLFHFNELIGFINA